jgi:hypothetical protein
MFADWLGGVSFIAMSEPGLRPGKNKRKKQELRTIQICHPDVQREKAPARLGSKSYFTSPSR